MIGDFNINMDISVGYDRQLGSNNALILSEQKGEITELKTFAQKMLLCYNRNTFIDYFARRGMATRVRFFAWIFYNFLNLNYHYGTERICGKFCRSV